MIIFIGLGNPGKKYAATRHNAGKMLAAWLKAEGGLEDFEILGTDCFMNDSGEFVKRIIRKNQLKSAKISSNRIADKSDRSDSGLSDLSIIRLSADPAETPTFPKLIIAHDDLDLPLGSFKIQFGTGPRLHKGILSIEKALGTKDFWRVRIGIDNRKSQLSSAKISLNQITDKPDKSESDFSDLSAIRFSRSSRNSDFSAAGEEYVLQPFRRDERKILTQTFRAIYEFISSPAPGVDRPGN